MCPLYSQAPPNVNSWGILGSPESEDLGGYSRFSGRYLHVLPVQGGPAVVDHGGLVGVEEGADLAEESGLWDQDVQSCGYTTVTTHSSKKYSNLTFL